MGYRTMLRGRAQCLMAGIIQDSTNAYREISWFPPMYTKNDVTQGKGELGKNDVTQGKLKVAVCHLTKKVNKAE